MLNCACPSRHYVLWMDSIRLLLKCFVKLGVCKLVILLLPLGKVRSNSSLLVGQVGKHDQVDG